MRVLNMAPLSSILMVAQMMLGLNMIRAAKGCYMMQPIVLIPFAKTELRHTRRVSISLPVL